MALQGGGGTETTGANEVDILGLSAEIVAAYVGQNTVSQTAIPELIRTVHEALTSLNNGGEAPRPMEKAKPAVPVGRSVQHDYIVCLEDGKKLKMLKRYLRSRPQIIASLAQPALYLLVLGFWLCWRAARHPGAMKALTGRAHALGFVGGLFDAAGGGWGPIVTSNLMSAGIAPAVAVGSSIVAEFFVTIVHVVIFAGIGGLRPEVAMVGLLVGGVVAAPLGPVIAARLPTRVMIFLVGFGVVLASASLVVR